jgi:hypothetical protein
VELDPPNPTAEVHKTTQTHPILHGEFLFQQHNIMPVFTENKKGFLNVFFFFLPKEKEKFFFQKSVSFFLGQKQNTRKDCAWA